MPLQLAERARQLAVALKEQAKAAAALADELEALEVAKADAALEADVVKSAKVESGSTSESKIKDKKKRDKKKQAEVEEEIEEDDDVHGLGFNSHAAKADATEAANGDDGASGTKKNKKRSRDQAEAEPVLKEALSENTDSAKKAKGEVKRFSRVDEEKALKSIASDALQDNTYEAVFGSEGYGAKANEKLRQVHGKDFRHEKTKKKRGSYRGGAIDDNAVRSVQFSDGE